VAGKEQVKIVPLFLVS